MTQRELADAAGLMESTLRSYELGARYPKRECIEAIASALDVRAEALDGYNIETSLNLVHAMFNCEERFGLIPDPNGFAHLTSTDPIVRCALHDWGLMRVAMLNEEISVEEYRVWNLNQLMRAINTYGEEEVDADAIARTIAKVDAALDEVGGWIVGVREQFKRNE